MRLHGTAALLLALTFLAAPASAGGDPPGPDPQCVGARTTGPIEAVVAAEVEHFGCEVTLVLLSGVDCTGTPAEGRVLVGGGLLTVVVPHCGPPLRATSASAVCPEKYVSAGVAGEVGVDDACKLHAHLVDTSQHCNFMPGTYPVRHDVVDNAAAHVSAGACGFLHADLPDPAAAAWLPFCPDHRVGLGAAGEVGYWGCDVHVHLIDDVVCTKLGLFARQNDVVELDRVHVSYTTCQFPHVGPVHDGATSTGGPCDRIHGPVTSDELTWTIDDRCRHEVFVDVMECPNQAQWTKTWETYEVHPNLTLHHTFCRLG